MAKVLIAPMTLATCGGPFLELLRGAGFELVFPSKPLQLTETELIEQLAGIEASLAGSEPYTRRVLQANPQLKVIARAGVGYDAVDVKAATEHGAAVAIAPRNQDAVAEHTFALILGLAKGLVSQSLATRAGTWPRQSNLPIRGRTLGIVGLGRIGKVVALRGAAFGMGLLAYEPYPDQAFVEKYGIQLAPLDQLLSASDWVTLHVPATPESYHMINEQTLGLMKPGAFLINTSRGALVDEADLYRTLRAKGIAGAGLDVFEQEPPGKNPLFELDNVLPTPHAAGVDTQSRDDMALSAAETIAALKKGEWPTETIVNPEVRAGFRW